MFAPQYARIPPAWFYPRILVGPGCFLSPRFVSENTITFVINCAYDEDSPTWWRVSSPTRYVCLNARDSIYDNILVWYPAFEAAMQRGLRDLPGNVYVHCQAGMNRSGCLALAYVCSHYQLPFESVVSATRLQRPILFQNQVFMNQVQEFIKNGRVSSEKNTRLDVDRVHDGDSGLFAPGDHPGASGDEDDAAESKGGEGRVV
jgi:hypothetical protein